MRRVEVQFFLRTGLREDCFELDFEQPHVLAEKHGLVT